MGVKYRRSFKHKGLTLTERWKDYKTAIKYFNVNQQNIAYERYKDAGGKRSRIK